jgi:diguanylate cyclase (GGDEF)-like protein/PAS domain S-box-containing protein
MMISSADILNANILIVDDQNTQVLILEGMLRNAGYTSVTSTTDPFTVCPLHAENNYDLILLDMKMPGMDGFQIIQRLNALDTDDYLPILAITVDHQLKLPALKMGAKDFISRPFNLIEVLARIQNMLEVRLLHKVVKNHSKMLEETVQARTDKLRESEARFRSFTAMSSDWYWEQDIDFRFTTISGTQTILGQLPESFIGATPWEVAGSIDSNKWDAHKITLTAHRAFTDFEYEFRRDNGSIAWRCISGEPLFDSRGMFSGYRGTGKDITQRKLAEEQIRFVALHDALTGLPNRTLLLDRMDQATSYAHRSGNEVWILFVDVDRFKFVNDSAGHKGGDQVIKIIAERLQAAVRECDTVARLGGDEFMLVLAHSPELNMATDAIRRIMAAVTEPIKLDAHEFFLSCSVGVAVFPTDGTTSEVLMERADTAMYRAKELGRNNFQFYTPEMNARLLERLSIEKDLRNAIERQEFFLHYQPQVELRTGRIIGMEALIRWQHPTYGTVMPSRFIGIAEEAGLIGLIGHWVLHTACTQLKAWERAGYGGLRMAVNLSARQFALKAIVQSISSVLAETEVPACCLELELTEGLLMNDVEETIEILQALRALGVLMSIDDFGTGYSSLAYLKRFPIDVLKIDQSFIRDMTWDSNDAVIVKSVISLAHNMKLRVVAEGVESQEQLTCLRDLGCDVIQGYLFSKPVSAEDFGEMLSAGKRLSAAM